MRTGIVVAMGILLPTLLPGAPDPADAPPFVSLKATSLKTGNRLERDRDASYQGGIAYRSQSRTTMRILAVEVETRTFRKTESPIEIQCFFIAKDAQGNRYVYDAARTRTNAPVAGYAFQSRELFGGTQTVSTATSTDPFAGTDAYGNPVSGAVTTKWTLTETRPGSSMEGWLVRLVYKGNVFKSEASLQELRSFGAREREALDDLAAKLPLAVASEE